MFTEYKMISKRSISLSVLVAICIGISLFVYKEWKKNQPFSFGVIADCQYCSDPGSGIRKYAASEQKLKQCVDHFNTMDLAYVVHLGDFIDRDMASFKVVGPIFEKLKMSSYHVLGNHDFSVSDDLKSKVPQIMGLESRYYDFEINGWRFVVLDGNDISFHAYPATSQQFKDAEQYYKEHHIQTPKWNGAIGDKQLSWLADVLEEASTKGEKAVLYCHFPVFPENQHNLWNADEIIELIENNSCVKAYMNGHNHAGNYAIKEGIHYLTFQGMVDTKETSYATIQVKKDQMIVTGFGREENRILEIK